MKVVDVAALAGFCDQSYLDRCFRRFCQCSPSDFARRSRPSPEKSPNIQDKDLRT
jgi:AraC-like DNA-binding protein